MAALTVVPTALSGFGVIEPLEADLTASTLGQAGPVAGYPEPQEDAQGRRPALVLSATGEQTAGSTVQVMTQTPGTVGSAGYVARLETGGVADTYWRGANLPAHLVGCAFPGWDVASNQFRPHAVTLDDEQQVIVYEQTSGLTRIVKSTTWDPATATYASSGTVASALLTTHAIWPCLLVIPDPGGSEQQILLCAFWRANDDTDEAQVDIMYSRDYGVTWGIWARSVLPDAIVINTGVTYYALGRLALVSTGGQITLFAHLTANAGAVQEYTYQYKSGDTAVTFWYVDRLESFGYPSGCSIGNVGYVAMVQSGNAYINLYRFTGASIGISAWSPLKPGGIFDGTEDFAMRSGAPAVFSYAAFGITATRDEKVLVVAIQALFAKGGFCSIWDPVTETEISPHASSGRTSLWWNDGLVTSTEYPANIAVTMYRGQARVYCTMVSSISTFDDRLTRLDLGGPITVTMPPWAVNSTIPTAWMATSIPTALASVYGAIFTGAGARSISTNTGWETLTTTANTAYYTVTFTAAATDEVIQLFRVRVDSGGGVSSRVIACGIRMAGVGYGFEFELRFSTTQIRLRDIGAATDVATVTPDQVGGVLAVDVLLAMKGDGTLSVWYRSGTTEDQYFEPIETGYGLTDDAGAGGIFNVIMWGHRASGTAVSRWISLGRNYNDQIDLAGGLDQPADLRPIPFAPTGAYALGGVYVGATAGPTIPGDLWYIRPDAERHVRYLSPVGDVDSAINVRGGQRTSSSAEASGWWATAPTGDVVLAYRGGANRYLSALFAIHTEGCNGRNPSVIGVNADTATTDVLGTLTNSVSGLRFLRASASSPVVRVDTSGSSSSTPYIRANSLVGGWFHDGAGKVRPIVSNSEGRWSNAGDAAPVQLVLGGIDGTEATSGTGGIIVYPRATFIYAAATAAEYSAFGLRWTSAPDLYEAQIRCRVLAVARVAPLLHARSWGVEYSVTNPATVTEARSGLRRGRRTQEAGRRVLSIPLATLWSQRPIVDPGTEAPRVYKAYTSGSYPIAGAFGDEFGKLLGTWIGAGGSADPVLWLPRIAVGVTTQSLVGDDAALYGRITSTPTFSQPYGRDTGSAAAPVWSGDTWTIEEER